MDSRTDTHTTHPCFAPGARNQNRSGLRRIHLPVAPRANCRTRYADSAPTRPAMLPVEARDWLADLMGQDKNISIVGITGPGDPLATPDHTLATLRLVREAYPDLPLCVTTRGIGGAPVAGDLAEVGLSHITVLMDAVTPELVETLYAWIRPGTKTVPLPEAAKLLLEEQVAAITAFKEAGLVVKVNVNVYPGVNSGHVEEVAKLAASLGADILAVTPYTASTAVHEDLGEVGPELLAAVRDKAGKHIRLMPAFETCGDALPGVAHKAEAPQGNLPKPSEERPNVAVVSSDGMDIDLHLGHAARVMVYGPREDGLACLLEVRDAPEPGGGTNRWEALGELLSDCFVLLTASAGVNPRQVLSEAGLRVMITDGNVEGTVDVLYGGGKKGGGKKDKGKK